MHEGLLRILISSFVTVSDSTASNIAKDPSLKDPDGFVFKLYFNPSIELIFFVINFLK